MAQHNFKKTGHGLNYVKEIIAKKHSKQKAQEDLHQKANRLTEPKKSK